MLTLLLFGFPSVQRSRRRSTCLAYKRKAQIMKRSGGSNLLSLATTGNISAIPGSNTKLASGANSHSVQHQHQQIDIATKTSKLKDPPSYSTVPSPASFPSSAAKQSLSCSENQSTSSRSLPPQSRLLPKDQQQTQILRENESKETAISAASGNDESKRF